MTCLSRVLSGAIFALVLAGGTAIAPGPVSAQAMARRGRPPLGADSITERQLRAYLTSIAADELEVARLR